MKKAVRPRIASRLCRLGPNGVKVSYESGRVCLVEFVELPRKDDSALARALEQVLAGGPVPKSLQQAPQNLPDFTRKVLAVCAGIKPGCVMTYGEVAKAAGRPRNARGAGQALAYNPLPLLIPCHRVVASDHRLQGFHGGLEMKEFLLKREGWTITGTGKHRRLETSR